LNKERLFLSRYDWLAQLNFVARKGYYSFGYYKTDDGQAPVFLPFDSRIESDGEHTYMLLGVAYLLIAIFGGDAFGISEKDYYGLYTKLLLHELAEKVTGDSCDDGTRDEVEKDRIELQLMKEFVNDFSPEVSEKAIGDFIDFQKKDDLAYMIDKFQFVLGQIWLYSKGLRGSIKYKLSRGTFASRDMSRSEVLDTDNPVFTTTMGFLEQTKGIEGREIFVSILKTSLLDHLTDIPEKLLEMLE